MKNIPTAEEWLSNHKELSAYDVASYDEGGYLGVDEKALYTIMVEFAKFHVESALKEAEKSIKIGLTPKAKQLILNAYPLENIK